VRLIGVVAAHFGADKDRGREALDACISKVGAWNAHGDRSDIHDIVDDLRGGELPVCPCTGK
jgi:hypothetical protein